MAAGVTVGVMLIPQGMAYAMIAGLPPVYGLYASLVPLAVYALLGTSRQLAVGPVAMVALLVANGVAPLAGGDTSRYLALAVLLALLVGVIQLLMGVLRAGFLVNLLSHPVLAGFTSAAAIIIGTSQLGGLTGLSVTKGPVHEMLLSAGTQWGAAHGPTVAIGVLAITAGVALRQWIPRLPAPMVVVGLGTIASWGLALGNAGVQVVGTVPSGLPTPAFPGLSVPGLPGVAGVSLGLEDLTGLLPIALAISLVGFMESIAVAKVYASRGRYDIDADQELRALGAANLAAALFQAFPVTGGFSRTAVNAQAGARSQISSLISAAVIAVTLLFLTPLFYHLPKAILAAIIVVAVAGLVDIRGAQELWRVDRRDFALMVATFGATLTLGIEEGILVGAALSVTVVLHQIARPHIAVLGRMPDSNQYRNVERNPQATVEPDLAILRMDASLFYGNAEAFRDAARSSMAAGELRTLILDAYPINRTDSTGLHVLHELVDEIHAGGRDVHVAGAKGPLRDQLAAGGLVELIGPDHFHPEVWCAVDAARSNRVDAARSNRVEVP
jgi:SulP family sulfate permease